MPIDPDKLPDLTDAQYERFFKTSVLIRANYSELTGAETKVLHCILSDSLGMGRENATLSINDFVNGYDDERGWMGPSGVGRSSVQAAIASLLERGIIVRQQASAREAHSYRIVPEAL